MASPPTSPLASTEERSNGTKLYRLLGDRGTSALRRTFDYYYPPLSLPNDLNGKLRTLNNLRQRKVLNERQWYLLFPTDGTRPDSSIFDISLLYILLRNICGLHPPPTGWKNKPPLSDTSLPANIVRIKHYRNLISHSESTKVSAQNFEVYWQEISDALVALGEDRNEIDALKEDQEGGIHMLSEFALSDFKAEIEYHTNEDRFQIGTRDWIFRGVEDWLDDKSCRHQVMIITGEAGMGKSVIAAKMCKRMEEQGSLSGWHFCQHDVGRYRHPKLMLKSLAFQMSCSLPGYRKALVKQLSRHVNQDLDNLGVEDLFALLFKEPLSSVANPGRNVLVVIDGIDEIELQWQNELLDVIANHFCRLPGWIRLLVTARPERRILDRLQCPKHLELKQNDEKNREDINLFFQERIHDSTTPEERPAVVTELIHLSEGLMLYAYCLMDLIEKSTPPLTPEQLLSSLPRGTILSETYRKYFQRMEAKLQEGLANNHGDFLTYFLSALTAAKDPLPKDFVTEMLQWYTDVSANDRSTVQKTVDNVFSCISSLLPIRDGHVYIFHKSVRDWLTENSPYGNNEEEGHRTLSTLCTAELDKLKTSCVNDGTFSDPQKYALQHGFGHMLKALKDPSQMEELVNAYVTDLELVYARLCAKNSDVVKDLVLAQEHPNSGALSEQVKTRIQSLQLQFKKHGSHFRELPQMMFQNLLMEGGPELSGDVSDFLSTKHSEMPYLELVDKNEHQSPVEARFYCSDKVVCFDVSPDRKHMVCECRNGTIHLWSLLTGELEWTDSSLVSKKSYCNVPLGTAFRAIDTNNEAGGRTLSFYRSVVFHPDGHFVLPGNLANVYNPAGEVTTLFLTSKCRFTFCAFSGDKNKMLTDCPDNSKEVIMWDIDNGNEIKRFQCEENITSFAISHDGNRAAISDSRGSIWVSNVETSTWQQVPNEWFTEAMVCGLLHFTTTEDLVCGSIVPTHSDGRTQYKMNVYKLKVLLDSTAETNDQSDCKGYLWPWESVDAVERLQLVCKVCHIVSSDLLVGFCYLLPREFALVGGPNVNYLTMLDVAHYHDAEKRRRTVDTAFSSDTTTVRLYTTVTNYSPKDPEDKPCVVTLSVQDIDSVRNINREESFEHTARRIRNGPLSLPVGVGVLLQTNGNRVELWNSDLSGRVQALSMKSEVGNLIPVSENLVGCLLHKSSSEGQLTLMFSLLDVSSWEIVLERELSGTTVLKSVACSLHRDVVFCSHQGGSDKRQMVLYKDKAQRFHWKKEDAIYQGGCCWRHPQCVFSPSGEVIVTWNTLYNGYGLHVLRADTGRKTEHSFLKNCYDIADCKFLNDGESVVCYRYDCNVRVFNIISGEVLAVIDIGERPTCIGSSPNQPLIAVGQRFSNVKMIRAQLPKQRRADTRRK